jgi:hypothetical protein
MAKRKTPKSQKVVDLKPQAEKLTQEELTELQNLVQGIDRISINIGRLEAQKHELLHALATQNDKVKLMQSKLESTYGNVDIDVRDGSITKKSDEQTNS